VDVYDKHGMPVMVGTGKYRKYKQLKLNPEYKEGKEYKLREMRPEWNCVALVGQVPLCRGQPIADTWVKINDISDKVELWLIK